MNILRSCDMSRLYDFFWVKESCLLKLWKLVGIRLLWWILLIEDHIISDNSTKPNACCFLRRFLHVTRQIVGNDKSLIILYYILVRSYPKSYSSAAWTSLEVAIRALMFSCVSRNPITWCWESYWLWLWEVNKISENSTKSKFIS